MNQPLISCIMPTKNRHDFIQHAIACWMSQTWRNRELIIVDDGEPVELPAHYSIRYCRVPEMTIGAKRNYAVAHADGEFVAHWDDDDFSAPDRLEFQMRFMEWSTQAVAFSSVYFVDESKGYGWCYHDGNQYGIGGSLLYRRSWAARHPFPDKSIGEDNAFIEELWRYRGFQGIPDARSYVARIHDRNTCKRDDAAFRADCWGPRTSLSLIEKLTGYQRVFQGAFSCV